MKNKMIKILLFLGVVIVSCTSKTKSSIQPISNNKNTEASVDTSLVKIADLPIYIDSTSYLIHPIGYIDVKRNKKGYISKLSGSRGSLGSYYLTNFNGKEISGLITNLKFQKLGTESFLTLTQKDIKILSVQFLRSIFNTINKQLLMYEVIESDTNNDGEVDYKDLKSIYLSNINGTGFVKVSPLNHQILSTQVLAKNNRLYFKTAKKLNPESIKPEIHYFYVDLSNEDYKAVEYNPVND